jgi:hypothetical protein
VTISILCCSAGRFAMSFRSSREKTISAMRLSSSPLALLLKGFRRLLAGRAPHVVQEKVSQEREDSDQHDDEGDGDQDGVDGVHENQITKDTKDTKVFFTFVTLVAYSFIQVTFVSLVSLVSFV